MRTEKIMTSKKKLIALLEKKYPDLVIFGMAMVGLVNQKRPFSKVSAEDRVYSSNLDTI
jgi:hypothetical protein